MKVAAVACSSYTEEKLEFKVREAINLIGGMDKFVKEGDIVVLKPNMLSPHQPELAITTHPAVVKAVIKLVQEVGGIVKVGESSGGMMVNRSLTEESFKTTGIAEVCEELEVEMVNFDRVETEILTTGGNLKIPLPRPLLEADVIISLPKLKTHSLTLFTGAIKNLYGCIPGMKKAEYHKLFPNPNNFAEMIVDLFELVNPDLAVMDGVIGLEGNGPGTTGTSCEIGSVLASEDFVALDTVAASYLGYKEEQVPISRIAAKKSLGLNDFSMIEVVGDFSPSQKDYNLSSNALLNLLPSFLLRPVMDKLLSKPVIIEEQCILCKRCVVSCPQDTIIKEGNRLIIKEGECIKCLCCQELCPQEAIEVKEHVLVKIVQKLKELIS